MTTTTLTIDGMTCMGCVANVTRLLKSEAGVREAQVTLTPGRAVVDYDEKLTSAERLKVTLDGYRSYETDVEAVASNKSQMKIALEKDADAPARQ